MVAGAMNSPETNSSACACSLNRLAAVSAWIALREYIQAVDGQPRASAMVTRKKVSAAELVAAVAAGNQDPEEAGRRQLLVHLGRVLPCCSVCCCAVTSSGTIASARATTSAADGWDRQVPPV